MFFLVLTYSELQFLQCRRNSVLDAFELTCRRGTKRCVSITCANEGKEYVDLAVFLRAGMRSQLNKLVEKKTMDIPNVKFRVNMHLRVAHSSLDNDVEKNISTITEITDNKNNFDENEIELGLLEGQKTWPSGSKTEESKVEEGVLLLRANTEPKEPGQMKKEPRPYNTYMDVNPLHLSIIAKQTASIHWIMENISKDEKRFSQNINRILEDKIVLANRQKFGRKDQSLDGMNALHLSSQYCPEAMEIIFETIYKYDFLPSNLLKIVQDNKTFLKLTPLHIAARQSSLKAAWNAW